MAMDENEPPPLSNLIRRHRLRAGWSQERLAERSGLSVRTISDLERGTRTGPRAGSILLLANALSLDEDQKAELVSAASPELRDSSGAPRRSPGLRQGLPSDLMLMAAPPTSLIGRERELADLVAAVLDAGCRLITLTGPGGVGKTRLALAVAEHLEARGDLAVALVSLASIAHPELVAPAIGQAFGLSDVDARTLPERLAFAVGEQPLLLVLDNFEHLLPTASLLSHLMIVCPTLTLLVTSRAVLRLSTEHEILVAPLALPEPGARPDRNDPAPAVRLFLERASLQATQLVEEEMSAAEAICRRVDGLPLAIELAAARARLLTPTELLTRMDRPLPLLTGGPRDAPIRLQTMRSAIAWSVEALTPYEQVLLFSLSVFSGGFTIAAAEAVSPLPSREDTMTALESLLDQSLIRRAPIGDGQARFTMLETIREYGLEQLASRGFEQDSRNRHAEWFTSRLGLPEPVFLNSDALPTFEFPNDQDNLRAALRWSLERDDASDAARLCLGLAPYWHHEGFFTEARETIDSVLDVSGALPSPLRSAVLGVAADFALYQGDFQSAQALATAGLSLARSTGDVRAICWHLHHLGWAGVALDPPSAIEPHEEMLRLHRELQDRAATAQSLIHLAEAKLYLERLDEARAHAVEAHALITALDPPSPPLLASIIWFRAKLAMEAGDLETTESLLTEAMRMPRSEGNKLYEIHSLRFLGALALARGNNAEAARCFDESLDLSYLIGSEHCKSYCFVEAAATTENPIAAAKLLGAEAELRGRLKLCNMPNERRLREQARARATAALGDSSFGMAFDRGRLLSSSDTYAVAKEALAATKSVQLNVGSLLAPTNAKP
jgi:predicted ATPase/transcriptional regulator with XRE-family HTH domain